MFKTYHETTTGRQVADSVALDERGNIKSGYTLRVHSMMMDSAPSFDPQAGSKDYSHVERYRKDVSTAWMTPDAHFAPSRPTVDASTIPDIYDRYDQRIRDAWKSPGTR